MAQLLLGQCLTLPLDLVNERLSRMNNLHFAVGRLPLPGHTSLTLGDRHPSTAGVMGLEVLLEGGIITRAGVTPGYLHRGQRSSLRCVTTGP